MKTLAVRAARKRANLIIFRCYCVDRRPPPPRILYVRVMSLSFVRTCVMGR
jgi:hypothetical protein